MRVLVTGASGFIAGYVVTQLLEAGYTVRGTVRSLEKKEKYAHLTEAAEKLGAADRLQFVEADLLQDGDGDWDKAVKDCEYVMHVASVFQTGLHPEEYFVKPAVDGTRRVLEAVAATHGAVKRVVVTSSVAAVAGARTDKNTFNEKDWSDVDGLRKIGQAGGYTLAKTLAEQFAWKFVEDLAPADKFELVTVLPSYVQGPCMSKSPAASHEVVRRLLNRQDPGVAKIPFNVVDVRDVAKIHVRAIQVKEAAGQRYIASSGFLWMTEISGILAEEFNSKGYNVSTMELPYFLVWTLSWCIKEVAPLLPYIGLRQVHSNQKAKEELGIEFTSPKDAVLEMAYSQIDLGLIEDKRS